MFHNLKLFDTDAGLNFEIHFDSGKRFYCLFGENGFGKTNLLQNLARTMIAVHSIFLREKGQYKYGALYNRHVLKEVLKGRALQLPQDIEVAGTLIKDRRKDSWGFAPIPNLFDAQLLRSVVPMEGGEAKPWVVDQPIVVVGTSGRGQTSNLDESELHFVGNNEKEFLRIFNRTWNGATADNFPTEGVASWIASRLLVNPAFVVGTSSRANEVVALCQILKKLDPAFKDWVQSIPPDQTRIAISFQNGQLFVGNIPVDKLATGYIAAIKIIQEIIAAYGAWGGIIHIKDLLNIDGIVLIDEIEAHLHPRWQLGLVPLLKTAFPNTTFIVCTHSPLVVSQTEEGEAYELIRTGNSVTSRRLGSPRDWYLADVYSNAFHVELPLPGSVAADGEPSLTDVLVEFSVHVKDYLAKREDAKRTEAMELYEKLAARLPEDDPRRRSLDSLRNMLT